MMWALAPSLSCKGQDDLNMKLTCGWELLKYNQHIVCANHGFILHEVLEPKEGRRDNCNPQGSPHSVCPLRYSSDYPH